MKKLLNKVRRSNESKESNVNSAGETAATKELPQQPITAEKQLTNDLGASPKRRSSIFSSLKKKKQTSGAVSSSSLASQRSSSSSSASNVNVIAAHQQHQLQSAGVNGNSFVLATSILSAEEAAAVSAQQQQSADILLEEPEEEVQEEEVEIAALPPASVLESTSRITVPASELPQHPSLLSAQIPSDLSSVMSVSSEKSLGDKMLDLPTNDIVNTTNVNFSTTETATVPVTPLKFPASLTSLQLLSYRAAYLQAVEAKSVAEAQLLQLQNIPAIAPLEDQGLVEKTLYLSEEISRLRDKACRLENENTSLTCKLEDQSLKLENASTSLNQYRAELELALEKSAVLEVQVQSQQDTAVSTEAEMQQIKETLESHRTQMSMSSSDALVIKSENNALKALVSSLQTKLTSLDGKLKQVLEPEAYTKLILAVQEEHQPEMAVIDDSSVVAFKDMLNSSIQECDRLKDELQIKTEECVQFEDLYSKESSKTSQLMKSMAQQQAKFMNLEHEVQTSKAETAYYMSFYESAQVKLQARHDMINDFGKKQAGELTELVAKQLSSLKDLSKLAHECIQDMSVFKAVTEYERSEKNRLAALLKQTESEYRNQLSYYFQYRSSVISSARDFLSDMVGYSSGGVEVSQSQLTKLESLLEPVLANEGYVSYLENKLSNSEHTIDYLSGRCENDAMQSTSCLISKLDSLDTLLTNVEWAFQEASQDIAGSLRRNTRKQINSFMNIPKGDENSSPAASPRLASTVADSALALRDSIKGVLGITEIKGSEFMAPNSINNNLGAPSLLNGMELFDLKSELSQLLDTLKPSEPHHSASSSDALWKSPALTFSAFLSNIMSKAADAKSQLDQTSQQSTLDQHLIFSLYNHPASSPQHVASATARRRASFLLPPTVSTTADGTTTTTNSLAQQPLLLSSVRRLSIPNSESHVTDNETFYTARTWRSEAAPSTAPAIVISPTLQSQQLPHRSNALRSTATNNSQRFSATADEIVNDTLSYIRSSVRKVVQLQLEEENLENQLTNVKSAIMNSETDLNTSLETAHRIEEELNNVKLERLITIEERLAPALVTLDSTVADEGSGVTQMELSYHLQLSYANDYLYKIQLLEAQLAVGRAQVAELETRVSTPYQLALPLKPKSATELGTAPSQSSIMSSGDDACTDILDGYAETGSDYEQSSDREAFNKLQQQSKSTPKRDFSNLSTTGRLSPIPSSEESVLGGVDHDGGQSRDEILNEALNGLMQEYHSLKHKYDELEDSSLAANNSQKEELDRLKLTLLSLEESRNELLSQHAELTAKFNGLDAMYTERVSKNAEQFEATIKQFNAENKLLLGFPAIKFTAASLSPSASSMEMRQPQLETADAGANSDKNTVALLTSDVIERCKYDQLVLDHHLSLSFINDLSVEKTMYHTAQRMSKIKLENLKASHSSALDLLSAAAMEIGAAGTAVSPDTLRRSRELRSSFESMANNQSSYGLFGATSTNVAEMGNEADNNEVSSVMPHTRILEPEDALSIYDVALNEHKASGKEQLLEMQVDELKEQTLQYEATITRLKHEIQHLVAQSHQDMESSNLAFTEKMDRVNAQLLQVSELKLAAESKIEDVNMQLEVQGAQYASILAIHTSTESELKETRESLSKLQCRLDELNNRQDSIEKENLGFQMSKLEMLKSSLEQEVAALTERLAITEQDLTAALGSKTLLEQDLEAEKAHSTQLGVSIADLQSQSATRIALLEEEIIQLQDTLSHRQVEISTLGETVASSQSDLFSTTQEKEILQQELQKLRENISIHLDIVNEMKSNHVSHKEEMDAMSTKLKVLEEVIAGKDTDNGNLINDINSIHTTHKNEMDSMSFKVRALEQEIANKESINGDLLRTIQTTKLEYEAAISTADLELARLSGQIEHLQSELEIVSASRDLLETMNRKSVLARELSYESIASESSKLIIQIASLEQKVSVLESQVSSGEQAIVSLEEQNGELGLKSVALETTLSKSNALNFSLQVQLATATQKLSRLETENSELLSTTAVIKTQADEAAARLESLIFTHSKTVQEIETTNTDLLAKIHSLEAKDNNESNSALHELKYQLESVQQERDELLVNYSQLYESRTVIEKKLTESNTNHSSIAQQLAVQRDRIHQLEAEISTKSSVEVSFVDAAASTNIDVVSVSQYDDRCSSLSLEISALQAELEATKSLLSSSQDKVAELDLLISDLDESRNQLLETTKSQTTEIANLEASFMEREALMSAHQLKETSDFESRLLDLKNQLEMKLTQESINKEIIASLEEKIKALNVKVSDLSEEIDDYKAQVKDLEVGIREKTLESTHVLEASSLDHEHSIAKIQSELDISKELVIRLEIERSEMESQIIIYKQEALHVKNSLEEIHQIASQQSEHSLSEMNVQLDDLKALCDLQKAELVKIERKLEESVCSLQKSQLDSKELESEIAKLTLENKSLLSDLDKERVTMSTRLSASKDLQIEIEAQLEQSRGQTEAALLEMARCKEELALSCADLRQNADSTETMEAEIALLKEKVLQFNVLEDTVCTLKRQLAEAERGNESLKKGFELEADAVANRHKAQLAVVKDAQHASSALSSMLESRIKELETVIDQQKASHLIQLDQISSKNAHLEEELSILYSAQKIHLEEVARGHETEIKKLKSSLSLEKLPEIDAISSGQLLWIKYQQEVLDHHLQMSYINDIEANFVQPVLYQGLFSATNNNAVSMSDVTVHVDLTDIDEVSLHDMKQLDSSADIREVKMINLRKEVFRLQQLVLDMHSLKVKEEDHLRQELISQNRENALLLSQILSGSPTTRESSVSSPRSPLLLENSFMVNRSTSPVLFAATKSPASPKSVLKDDLTNVSTVVVSLKQQDVQKLEKACEVSTQLTNRLSSFISTMPAAPRLLAQEYEQFMSRLKQLLSSLIKVSDELMKPAHFFSLAGLSKLEKIASQQSSRVTLVEASITFLASKIHEMFSEIGLHRKYMTALADILGVANSRSYLECSTVGQLEQIKLGFETWQVEKSTLRQLVVDESTSSNNEMMDKNTTTKFATVATSPLRSTTPITSTKQVSTSPLRSLPTRQVSDNAMQTMPVIEDVHAKRLMTTAVQSDLMYTDVMSRAEWGSLKSDYDLKLQEKQALIALMDEQTRTFMFRSNSSTSTQTSTKSKTPIGVQTEKERGQAASFLPSPMLQDSSSQYDGVMGLGTSQNAHAQTSTSPVRMVTTVSTQSRILNTSDSASMTEEKERISTSTQMSSSTTSSPPRSANPVVDRVISPHIFAFTGPDSPKTTTTANSNKSKNVQLRVRERSISVQKTTTVSKTTGNIHHRQHVDGDSLVLDEEEIERTFMLEIDEEGSTSISLDLAGLLESLSPKSGRALQEKLEEEEDAGAQVARTFDQLRNSFGIDNIKANLEPLVATAHEALEADYGHQQQQLTPRQERAMMELQQRQVDESQYHQQNVDFDPVRQELVIIEDIAFVRSLSNASLSQTADAIKSYYQQQQESSETSHFLSREYLQDIKDETRASLAETANAIRQYSQHESKLVSIDGQSLTSSMDEEAMMVEMDAIHKESSISLEKTAESIRMYEERLMAIMASGGGRQYEDEDQENNVRYEQDIAHIKAATQSSIEETARIIKKYGGAGVGVEVKSASGIVSTSPLLTRNRSKSDLVPTPVGSTLGRLYQ